MLLLATSGFFAPFRLTILLMTIKISPYRQSRLVAD